jgi:ornithine carbamoyltransferase
MNKVGIKHFLTGEEFTTSETLGILDLAESLRVDRNSGKMRKDLDGQHLAMIFEKPSLRTRASFQVAMHELGGEVVESSSNTSKKEEPEDVVRVMAGYCKAIMLRTHEHLNLEKMVSKSPVPVINGLSDTHHPCQILADLLTLKQSFGTLVGLNVTYVGDGNNILHSLLLLAPSLGIHLRYACPPSYGPSAFILKKAKAMLKEAGAQKGSITGTHDPLSACKGTNAIYTDVWTSMGFEGEAQEREQAFGGFQVNEELYGVASPNAVIMHCLPMQRGKEIAETMVDHPNSVIFRQSENRLHVQKALLLTLLSE